MLCYIYIVGALVKPLEKVLARRQVDKYLRVSALSILSTACQTCPMALKGFMQPLTNWVLNILEFEKEPEIRRGKKYSSSSSPILPSLPRQHI